jgi:hypothetical protein
MEGHRRQVGAKEFAMVVEVEMADKAQCRYCYSH